MWHVSTYLPFSDVNSQQLERKRHLGNDIVLVGMYISIKERVHPSSSYLFFVIISQYFWTGMSSSHPRR